MSSRRRDLGPVRSCVNSQMLSMATVPAAGLSSLFGAPPQAASALSIEPYLPARKSPNSFSRRLRGSPVRPLKVQKSRLSSFWSWMIATAASAARGMPV